MYHNVDKDIFWLFNLLLLFISTNIKVKISKAKQFKCTPLHFIRTSVGNTSLLVFTCYKNRYNFDIRKKLKVN